MRRIHARGADAAQLREELKGLGAAVREESGGV